MQPATKTNKKARRAGMPRRAATHAPVRTPRPRVRSSTMLHDFVDGRLLIALAEGAVGIAVDAAVAPAGRAAGREVGHHGAGRRALVGIVVGEAVVATRVEDGVVNVPL